MKSHFSPKRATNVQTFLQRLQVDRNRSDDFLPTRVPNYRSSKQIRTDFESKHTRATRETRRGRLTSEPEARMRQRTPADIRLDPDALHRPVAPPLEDDQYSRVTTNWRSEYCMQARQKLSRLRKQPSGASIRSSFPPFLRRLTMSSVVRRRPRLWRIFLRSSSFSYLQHVLRVDTRRPRSVFMLI